MTLSFYKKKTKYFLVFFCFLLFSSCWKKNKISNVLVNYISTKAVSVSFVSNNVTGEFSIHLKDNETSILGNFSSDGNTQTFTPIISFTSDEVYEIRIANNVIESFAIESKNDLKHPELISIYPTINEVPENMLKMYFVFSNPMQEVGKSLDFIKVFDKTKNKEVDVFLELETELWNKNQTILTLWLDPGRIKKDLIPNKEKGLPILKGHEYQISISKNFRDANGNHLKRDYIKEFSVNSQDKTKPSTHNWEIQIPKSQSVSLKILFNESLDAILIKEVFSIYTSENKLVKGEFVSAIDGFSTEFIPSENWKIGKYKIQVESRLEDLAGNNLNRLFDEDLTKKTTTDSLPFKEIYFNIE